MSDLAAAIVAFIEARLDEDEKRARKRLCIYCGNPTAPLRSALGVTGYTHDRWDAERERHDGWEGQRCPGRLTGAEPVQDPARVLRDVAAKRAILARWRELDAHRSDSAEDEARAWLGDGIVANLAAADSAHPEYEERWKP
jgi:hypothetical protein